MLVVWAARTGLIVATAVGAGLAGPVGHVGCSLGLWGHGGGGFTGSRRVGAQPDELCFARRVGGVFTDEGDSGGY